MNSNWLVVLRANGVVDSVEGGAPVTWLGRPLTDAPDCDERIARAARELVDAAPTANVRRRILRLETTTAPIDVELLLVEALPLRRAHTRVHELTMRTLDLFATQAVYSRVDLTIDRADDVPSSIYVDGEKLAWALSTLVANALRYAERHVGVHLRYRAQTETLVIEVADDGPGMPEHVTRWLFERDPSTGKSAGLALLLVRDVLAAHRGSVEVRSDLGRGTTFSMLIPRVDHHGAA